jgi:outer membrane lipoprotein-sorting protein
MMIKRAVIVLLALTLGSALAACGGGELTAEEILNQAADAMSEVESLRFTIEHEGEPVILNQQMGAAMISAEGAYQAPDSVYAKVRVQAGSIIAEAEAVWLAEGAYLKLPPLLPTYTPIDLGETFDAAAIFDSETGLPQILRDLSDPTLVGEEDLEGVSAYHITAQADGEKLSNLVGGALEAGPATLDVWIEKGSMQVAQVTITEASGSVWTIYFYDFGDEVEIPTP